MIHDKKLLVRADDMGSTLASNIGCLTACTDGIARSIEVMMPCAWIEHAANTLSAHPDIDIGIHLTLTSEWNAAKWRPLTPAKSLIDERGNFLPLLMPRAGDDRPSLYERDWALDDIAGELRAQIVRGLQMFPQASHVSSHMVWNFSAFDSAVGNMVSELCAEFKLMGEEQMKDIQRFEGYPKFPRSDGNRTESFIHALRQMKPGTHIFVDHPAIDTAENRALGHPGYEDVQVDRSSCLSVLTNPKVLDEISTQCVQLIDHRDLL